jgi:hypothetical protein
VWRASFREVLYATHTWVLSNYRAYNVGKFPWASYGAFWADGLKYTSLRLMRATPALLAVEGIGVLWAIWSRGFRAELVRLLVLLLALSAIGAIVYFPDIVHIAFVLPYVLVVVFGMLFRLRTWPVWSQTQAARTIVRVTWAAALALVLVKGWTNARQAWADNPVRYETAFGTLAGSDLQAETVRDLREKVPREAPVPLRIFAYPTDAWVYLALPADNPTPFALLRPVYNTPEQFQTAIDRLEQDPRALVLLNGFSMKADDPFLVYLQSRWPVVTGIGPPVFMGTTLYKLYAREPTT